jgi:hypothetical protein
VAELLRPMLDQQLSVVFYDLTTVRIHGEAKVENDLRCFGMNKETGGIARAYSTPCRSEIPRHAGHPFHGMPVGV